MITTPRFNRRSFIISSAAAGAGLALGLKIPFGATVVRAQDGSPEINAWVVIRPDDTVVIRVARSEMGQGTITGLAQMVAEELECDWSKVTTEYPTPGQSVARKRVWGDFSTGGSRGIRTSQEYVRQGGAVARQMLIQAAANGWSVPASECSAANSVITHKPTGRTTTYGKVAEAAAKLTPPDAKSIALKDPKDWKLIGKSVKRLDTVDKVTGAQVSSATIAEMLKQGLDAPQAFVRNQNGDAKATLAGATKKVEAVYAYPFQNHAPMEPMNATAKYTADRCEVWVPTQNGEAAFAATLAASGLPADKCEVYKINLGGGFGRRGAFHDYVTQAVLIAKQIPGTPVKLLWTREEDMTHGRYHPVMQSKLVGALDASGNLTALHLRLSGQSILAAVFPQNLQDGRDNLAFQGLDPTGDFAFGYTIPNLLIDHAMRNTHVPPGFWRGVNINQNAIFVECFMDELAKAAGQDPLEFRRKLMTKHPKHLAVLNAVADRAGWSMPKPQGVHRGLAQMMAFGSYVAACAEISVKDGNKIDIHRIICATDPGYAVNPAQIERQIAGSFVYGLSALFMEECTVKDGRIEQTNFHNYDSMRIAHMPKVESIVMPSGGFWGGVGEPTICVAAPAVLNAYAAATGKRIRTFPLKNHGLQMV